MFLCDRKCSFIKGQEIIVDGGMTKLMVYHNDCGWTYKFIKNFSQSYAQKVGRADKGLVKGASED